MEQSEWRKGRETGTERHRDCESVYVSRSLRADHDVISPSTRQRVLSRAQSHLPSRRRREHHREVENFSGTQRAKEHSLLSPSPSIRTQGPAQSNPMGGEEEDRTGVKT